MQRREFITLLGGTAVAWPLPARAQQASKAARIGYLAFRSPISADDAFLKGLFELGWVEGQNIVIERRFAAGNEEQLKGSAAELVRLKVDVIVTAASATTKVAKRPPRQSQSFLQTQAIPLAKGLSRAFRVPGGTSRGSLSMQARTLPPNKRSCSLNLSQQCPAWLSCGIRPAHSCIPT